jgi:predicted DNA-binding ribbon-helix-helix protein
MSPAVRLSSSRIAWPEEPIMKSTIVKRSIAIDAHKTSISLEEEFWKGLKDIARARQMTLTELIPAIRRCRQGNLSSAIRVFVFDHYLVLAPAVPVERFQSPAMMPSFIHDEAQAL